MKKSVNEKNDRITLNLTLKEWRVLNEILFDWLYAYEENKWDWKDCKRLAKKIIKEKQC